jgi:hypothetical protein
MKSELLNFPKEEVFFWENKKEAKASYYRSHVIVALLTIKIKELFEEILSPLS